MGCIDKVGGIVIAIIAIIASGGNISVIVGGIVFVVLTFIVEIGAYSSFIDSLDESPFQMLVLKFFVNALISTFIGFLVSIVFGEII